MLFRSRVKLRIGILHSLHGLSKFVLAGMQDAFTQAMQRVQDTYAQLYAWNPHLASYVVPNAFNRRVLITANLRTLFHFISLRTAPNAHFAIRRIANLMREEVQRVSPILGCYLFQPDNETWQDIETCHFEFTGTK